MVYNGLVSASVRAGNKLRLMTTYMHLFQQEQGTAFSFEIEILVIEAVFVSEWKRPVHKVWIRAGMVVSGSFRSTPLCPLATVP